MSAVPIFRLNCSDVPEGKVEQSVLDSRASYVRWAPGNGLVYSVIVSSVCEEIKEQIGGYVLLSLGMRDGQKFLTYPANPRMIYHLTFTREKFEKDLGEEGVYYYTALLNWILFDTDLARDYAQEVFDEAKDRWKW